MKIKAGLTNKSKARQTQIRFIGHRSGYRFLFYSFGHKYDAGSGEKKKVI